MKINSINSTNFKGLLIFQDKDNPAQQQAINTDHIVKIDNCGTKNHVCTCIALSDGTIPKFNVPFDEVTTAYQKAGSTSYERLICSNIRNNMVTI